MYRLILFLLAFPLLLPAQRREAVERAQREFDGGDYAGAVRTLQNAGSGLANDTEATLLLAMSQFNNNQLLEAEENLHRAARNENDRLPLAWFYLGRIYHAQHRFDRAAVEYKRYLRTLDHEGPERRTVSNLLRNCGNGIRAGFLSDEMIAENMGDAVNSPEDEFGPIPSPTNNGRLYYTRMLSEPGTDRKHADIVYSAGAGGWSAPLSLNAYINSNLQETLLDISADGQRLYYFRGRDDQHGSLLVDTFSRSGSQMVTLASEAPISTANGDVTPFFGSEDAVYFSSNRPGGYGGLDLYRMERRGGGFGPAVNLGPNVNGPYDEITPFVAADNRTIYYSTNDPTYSIGGFDVVRTYRVEGATDQYTRPENAGLPLNSAGDDTFFRLASDSFTAFLSSDRKDGMGKRDIYIIYFVEPRTEMAARR